MAAISFAQTIINTETSLTESYNSLSEEAQFTNKLKFDAVKRKISNVKSKLLDWNNLQLIRNGKKEGQDGSFWEGLKNEFQAISSESTNLITLFADIASQKKAVNTGCQVS